MTTDQQKVQSCYRRPSRFAAACLKTTRLTPAKAGFYDRRAPRSARIVKKPLE
jgi:hypothetical protein